MRAKLLIVNCPLVPSARGPCSSVSTGWSMAPKDQKTPKRESQFQNIKHITAESCKMRFSLLYLLPHSHQFLNIRPLNISCDDCITGMWRIYKLVDLPNLVEGFIKSNGTIAARCSRFVSRAEERRGWRRPSVLTLPLPSFALEGWMVSGIGSICVSWEEEGRGHCWNRPSHCEEIKVDSTGCHQVTHYHYLSFHRFTGGWLFISSLTQTHCMLSSSITFTSPALFPPDDFFQYEIIYSLYAAPSKDAKTQLFK